MPVIEQGLGHDPDRVGEVDDPRARRGAVRDALGDVEHDRNGPECLREPARAGGLLADGIELQRKRLVDAPGRLAADAQLDKDELGAVERRIQVVRDDQAARPVHGVEHPLSQSADDLAALPIDVQRTSSSTGMREPRAAKPSTSSGVYVDPPPTTAILMLIRAILRFEPRLPS